MVLMIIRHNLTQMMVSSYFGVSQSTVSRVYRQVMPELREALRDCVPDLVDATAGRIVLVDGTDIPTGNRAGHDVNYSGKRHRQGVLVQVACATTGSLRGVSNPRPGKTHDRLAYATTNWENRLNHHDVIADPAYLGTSAITPRKKPRGGELSARDKANNKTISSIRSAVERCIAHLKNWKILSTGYRGALSELPKVIKIVTSLEFYRLGWRP
jgi:hypothetical protein